MIRKKNKGAALIVVIMVMAVMTILGATILNISLSQTMQASNEDKRIQAHYLARSGADATLSAWKSAPIGSKPIGACSPVYLDSLNQFVYIKPSNMIGEFNVIITNPDSVTTIITSIGTVGNVIQTTTVTIVTVNTQITDPISPTVTGDSLKWYNSSSGQANPGDNTHGPIGKTVLVSSPGLKLVKGTTNYQADIIKFTTNIWNFKYPLNLTADILIFNTTITTNNNGSNHGCLVLYVLNGVTRTGKTETWGRIEYKSQWYYYLNNKQILTDADFDNLEKISSDDPNYPNSSSPSSTSYSIKWS